MCPLTSDQYSCVPTHTVALYHNLNSICRSVTFQILFTSIHKFVIRCFGCKSSSIFIKFIFQFSTTALLVLIFLFTGTVRNCSLPNAEYRMNALSIFSPPPFHAHAFQHPRAKLNLYFSTNKITVTMQETADFCTANTVHYAVLRFHQSGYKQEITLREITQGCPNCVSNYTKSKNGITIQRSGL